MGKKLLIFITIFSVTVTGFISCGKASLDSDKAKYSYAIGQQVGNKIRMQKIDLDTGAFKLGLEDAIIKKSKLDNKELREAIRKMSDSLHGGNAKVDQKVKAEGKKYLEDNKKKPGVKVTNSGLQYEIIKKGFGPSPKATDVVKVHYKGTLLNGTEFDSSYKRKKPAEFPLNRVIKGWTEGLQLMKKGAKYKFTIPSELAYGDRNSPRIPGGSTLIFEVELLEIVKKK